MSAETDVLCTSIATVRAHEHGWCTESSHRTLEGVIRYVRCTGCGARRIDLVAAPGAVPAARSAIVPGGAAVDRTLSVAEQRA
ncbi:hypothetical protein ABLG96_00585 [Nakamurella sp. A5-74]|uniref:Uncharacterized protein n=1 Tax=Nakamurella sp. A5-74 TaxID=3158264 RepID=A0AAU8DQF7_9ACTN